MRNVIFDITPENVEKVVEQLTESQSDSMLVLAPMSGTCTVHAPSTKGKHKGYHRVKLEVWIPENAIIGEEALTDFGLLTLMRLPKNRVQPHLIREKVE